MSDDARKSLLPKKDNALMVMFWGDADGSEVTLTLDTGAMSSLSKTALQTESGQTRPGENGEFTFNIPGYDARIFRVE